MHTHTHIATNPYIKCNNNNKFSRIRKIIIKNNDSSHLWIKKKRINRLPKGRNRSIKCLVVNEPVNDNSSCHLNVNERGKSVVVVMTFRLPTAKREKDHLDRL